MRAITQAVNAAVQSPTLVPEVLGIGGIVLLLMLAFWPRRTRPSD